MEKEINLLEIFQILKKRFIMFLIIMLGITAVGGGISFLLNKQVYTSTATLIVGEETQVDTDEYNSITGEPIKETVIQYGNTNLSTQSIKFYNDVLKSSELLNQVINNLNLQMTVEDFKELISLEVPEDSGSIVISVSGSHLDNADIIVDEAVAIFKEKVIEITETERIKTMNTGSEPQIINTVNVTRNIIGTIMIGFVAGVVTVLILEYLDDSIQTETVIEDKLGIPVIGKIRSEETKGEDLRNTRTYMEFSPNFKEINTIIVATPTLKIKNISIELANVLVEAGKRVLLIDANLREPSIQKDLGISNINGLSDILVKEDNFVDTKVNYKDNKNYQIITAGNSLENPSEQLSNDKLKQLLEEESSNFDYTIINGHPVNDITDTVALSTFADGVILVVKEDVTKMSELEEINRKFTDVGTNILGIVFSEI